MESEFSLKMLLSVLRKSLIWIILISVLAAGATFLIISMATPVYSSYSEFYVINTPDGFDYTQSTLVSAAQALANDYIEIIKSDKMLERVCAHIESNGGQSYAVDQIRAMISCTVKPDAAVFTVTVNCTDRDMAKRVLEAVELLAPEVIDDTVKRSDCVEVITFAKDARQVSNNRVRNTLIVFAIAAVLSYVFFLIVALLDTTVNTEDDLKKKFDLPILGVIPEWGGN